MIVLILCKFNEENREKTAQNIQKRKASELRKKTLILGIPRLTNGALGGVRTHNLLIRSHKL